MSVDRTVREYVVILLCLFIVLYFITKGMFILALTPMFILLLFRMFPNASIPFMLMYIIGFLGLKLPFYPSNMPNELPFVAWFVVVAMASLVVKRSGETFEKLSPLQAVSLFVFMFNLLVIALIRGINISANNLSGIWYIVIAMAFAVFLLSGNIYLSLGKIKALIAFFVGSAVVKAAIQFLMIVTGSRFLWLGGFIDVSTASAIGDTSFGQRIYIKRLSTLNGVGTAITLFSLEYLRRNRITLAYIIFSLAFASAALSSYRFGLLIIVVCFIMYSLLFCHNTGRVILTGLIVTLFGMIFLYIMAPVLPMQMQRGISFLPGINISFLASESATATVGWRIDLWKYSIKHMHEFLLIGRGLVRDSDAANALKSFAQIRYFIKFTYDLHAYHSSIIGILIDLGIVGTVSFIVFVATSLRRIYRNIGDLKNANLAVTFLKFYFCLYISRILVSTVSGMNVDAMIYDAFMMLALLQVLTRSLVKQQSEEGDTQ